MKNYNPAPITIRKKYSCTAGVAKNIYKYFVSISFRPYMWLLVKVKNDCCDSVCTLKNVIFSLRKVGFVSCCVELGNWL